MKDLYIILQISPSANPAEIKKAFRRLALRYHPDKNKDPATGEYFAEIQEAYIVLKDPAKRAAYNYQRYLSGKNATEKPLAQNTSDVLQLSKSLADTVAKLDPFRADVDQVSYAVKDLLSAHHIHLLIEKNDRIDTEKFFHHLVTILTILPLPIVQSALETLQPLTANNPQLEREMKTFLREAKWNHYWTKYKIVIALVAALLFCLLIIQSSARYRMSAVMQHDNFFETHSDIVKTKAHTV